MNTSEIIALIAAERERQKQVEGWTEAHDDEHESGDLSAAASCYALSAASFLNPYSQGDHIGNPPPEEWPWYARYWKPKNAKQDLIRAGALIVAELERIDRLDTAWKAKQK